MTTLPNTSKFIKNTPRTHPREHRMNRDEALAEMSADQDSDISEFSDSEFQPSVSEESV